MCWYATKAGLSVAMIAFVLAAFGGPARAQDSVFDEVDPCDLLAAHPADPQRVAEGVADGSVIPRLAVRACEAAVQRHSNELRFSYQLGRALAAARRPADARSHLERAAQGGYAAATAALADMRIATEQLLEAVRLRLEREAAAARAAGRVPAQVSVSQITRTALSLLGEAAEEHRRAFNGGFEPSRQRADALTFNPGLYTQALVGQIVAQNAEAARTASQQPEARVYLYALVTNIMSQCGPVFDPPTVAALAVFRFGGEVSAEQEEAPLVAVQPLLGEVDAQRFVRRHGCDGPFTEIFGILLSQFLNSQSARR